MNTQKYLSTLKFFPALLGLTSISILTSLPAVASQTSLLTTNNKNELLLAQVETEVETPTAEDPAAASDAPDDASQDATAEEAQETAEGGAEQPTEDPAAETTPVDASEDAAVEDTEAPATGGAEQPTEDPAAEATPADASQPGLQAPPTTPPVMTAPAATPPEGGATQPPIEEPTGATPDAPTEDVAPTEVAPEGAMPAETEQPSTSTPGADDLRPEADANQDAQSNISEAELKQFATAIPQLSMIEKNTKGEITQIIGQSGLSQDKFNALLSGQQTNTPPAETSAEEKQSFEQAITKIQEIEQKGQVEQEQIIRSKGLEPQRFSQILAAVRQDQNLRTKVQQMLTN